MDAADVVIGHNKQLIFLPVTDKYDTRCRRYGSGYQPDQAALLPSLN